MLLASPAAAITSLSLIWDSTGTSTITVTGASTTTITAKLLVTLEAGDTLGGLGVSFVFDQDNQNELDFVSMVEHVFVPAGGGTQFSPLAPGPNGSLVPGGVLDSSPFNAGLVEGFDSFASPLGQFASGPITLTLGSVTFQTSGLRAQTDGIDVQIAVLLNGLDAVIDGAGTANCIGQMTRNDCPVTFGGATVNAPEPTTGLLLAFGLGLGLYYQRRR
ncbi:MAG: PEP-CTERM sorting domain-containing protein [Myxococcota bacterium]|nr:PEP-CTERM sorting domain-containing protein [Myxococcales bacterium]